MTEPQREMNLEEWCEQLPPFHAARRELRVLKHCREHPVKWALWDFLRRWVPVRQWKSPNEKGEE